MKTSTAVLIVGAALGVLMLVLSRSHSGPDRQRTASSPAIPYSLVDQHGDRRTVVVSPSFRNANDMRTLGEQLRRENDSAKFAYVLVYDDEKAARMLRRVSADEVSSSEEDFYDQHMIASYVKNASTGCNEFAFGVDGFVRGAITKVNY